MSVATLIQTLRGAGVMLEIRADKLRVDAPSGVMTTELRQSIQENKSSIMAELSREGECVPKVAPQPYIYRCPACNGTNWGQTGTLPDGAERWGCLDCAARPEGTPAPTVAPVPESIRAMPPGAVSNPCPQCNRPDRLFIPGSPHIPGEPDRDVLICGKCGCTEPACSECKGTNLVFDSIGTYCIDCRRRPGQPESEPAPAPCTEPALLSSRRHHLGEPEPPFPCPHCAHDTWIEEIYSWRCKACQNIVLKPDGAWPPRLTSSPDTSRGIPFPVQEEVL